ncbi:aminodeoxychorismate synthase component I [Sphingomonas sp. AR_OL41]|uniref:aminodeoxychorismate synthase component I n=1 Tax=Sphingomonas sp. AR_OL41 TaxID=3042729 RepID=UPI002480D0F8|nr:aminodeoxychorismate synthase component I [Sphingomonas sp. AR_OL41]MDH7973956.1 aminodeoxychorismate synthase component I [Sphingomonas sp. AR_OL41]
MLATETQPFILLDDARAGGAPARLYRAPLRVIVAETPTEVPAALTALRTARGEGLHAAGYLAYEAGAALQPRAPILPGEGPVLWFGIFDRFEEIAPDDVPALLPDPAGVWAGTPRPEIDRATYDSRLARVQALIEAGDIYQANLTYRATVAMAGDPLALYARLRAASHAGYGAIVATGAHTFLSLSPELFFALESDTLTCRPMKGTAPRGATPELDRALAAALAGDAKQRAENLMIVDLMRNDLSRVAAPGSVAVPDLFAVETYPTVLQMTSTVTATLAPDKDAIDVLTALFPCGSITGAPKSRAMEVIAEVEATRRGLYTGSIGRIDTNGDAMFNVAIRTLAIAGDSATLGLGSGIVADSTAGDEWAECAAKGAFVTAGQRRFDLIETMAFDPEAGIPRLERHLARMKASADALGFTFDRHDTRNELQAATFRLRSARRIRLVLSTSGAVAIEVAPLPAPPPGPVAVAIVPLPVAPRDFRLRHKTSDRAFYDTARITSGAFEAVFIDPQGFLTEGSFTSLFVARDGVLLTPPLVRGLLPGVLRAELVDTGQAVEAALTPADLAGGFFIGNALRGLMPAIVAIAK